MSRETEGVFMQWMDSTSGEILLLLPMANILRIVFSKCFLWGFPFSWQQKFLH